MGMSSWGEESNNDGSWSTRYLVRWGELTVGGYLLTISISDHLLTPTFS